MNYTVVPHCPFNTTEQFDIVIFWQSTDKTWWHAAMKYYNNAVTVAD